MTPRNMTTTDFLALTSTPVTVKPISKNGELVVKVYNYPAWKWEIATDAALIEAALAEATSAINAAAPNVRPYMTVGERIYVGDISGKRVCVEAC